MGFYEDLKRILPFLTINYVWHTVPLVHWTLDQAVWVQALARKINFGVVLLGKAFNSRNTSLHPTRSINGYWQIVNRTKMLGGNL